MNDLTLETLGTADAPALVLVTQSVSWNHTVEDWHLGPVIAPDADTAAALVARLSAVHEGLVRIDVPTRQTDLLARLVEQGFAGDDEAPVMLLGADRLPGRRDQVFAAATLAFG